MQRMVTWATVGTLCAALAGIGASTDRLLARSTKRRLYDGMTSAWYRLGETRVRDLPGTAAQLALRPFAFLDWRRRPARTAVATLAMSVCLTAIMALIGRLARRRVYPLYDPPWLPATATAWQVMETHSMWLLDKWGHYMPAILVNLVFDATTVVITLHLLRAVRASSRPLGRVGIVLANLGAAFLLAVASLAIAYLAVGQDTGTRHAFARALAVLVDALSLSFPARDAPTLDDAFFGASTLLPIGAYLIVLLVLVIAKALLSGARALLVYYLELAAEPLPQEVDTKFVPFTLLGLLFGAVGALAKLVVDLAGTATGAR
jgi:hypothetical protein